ncbi:MAG: DNA-processing protein DprA [Lachnospiraceae bacterium]|nr:DNA-processing protein DprA [Lachnospiraceae bacterium]
MDKDRCRIDESGIKQCMENAGDELIYEMWLALLCPGLRLSVPAKLSKYFGGAKGVYEAEAHELLLCGLLNEKELDEIRLAQKRGLPFDKKERWDTQGVKLVCVDDAEYPGRLRNIADPPYALWYRGELPDKDRLYTGIIGARSCSDYGRRSAEYFGRELAKAGVGVISGMAVGIDGLSQAACLEAGGKSYGILGSGPDVIYPRSNGRLYQDLLKNGGVISEYIPGTAAIASNFPRRNRIISALSDVLLVIEARERSGTFITVNFALEQGCDVYALPGRIDDPLSAGCNRLIRDGAGVACSVDDVLFGLANVHKNDGRLQEEEKADSLKSIAETDPREKGESALRINENAIRKRFAGNLAKDEVKTRKYAKYKGENMVQVKLLEILTNDSHDIDYLLRRINSDISGEDGGLSVQKLAGELMQLEMAGVIANKGGCYFIL